MAPEGGGTNCRVNLSNVLTISNKSFTVNLTEADISWSYKQKHPFSDKEKNKWKCKNRVPVQEIVAVEYIEKEVKQQDGEFEMVSLNSTAFRLHVVKRAPKQVWKLRNIEMHCTSSAQCALWVDTIRSLLEKFTARPKSLLVFINPFGGRRKAKQIFDEKVAPVFDLAGITSHAIITERAGHAKEYLETHDLNRYDGIVSVGGDGMFAELLNGILIMHNTRVGVNIDDERQRLRQAPMRIGVIPAGSTDTVAYCTTGINDAVTSALHIVIGDDMSIDVCSVRHGHTGKFIKFSVSMLGYGFLGDVLKDSETNRWMGPIRYDWSGLKTFLKLKTYQATVHYLPAEIIQEGHHPSADGLRCYTGCNVCQSASLMDLNGSILNGRLPELDNDSEAAGDFELESEFGFRRGGSVVSSLTDLSVGSRPGSVLSKYAPENWLSVTGDFIGISAHTISCRCQTAPDGVSPTCHLGDGTTDLVLVQNTSRFSYLKHLLRIKAKNSAQFDFGFVEVVRAKSFKLRVSVEKPSSDSQASTSFHRLENEGTKGASPSLSSWNCDGEVIEEPNVDVRVHCQLVRIFARGIEPSCSSRGDQCSNNCISCSGVLQ